MTIHFDGKLMQDLTGRSKVDRIAVLASYNGTIKFLGAPKIQTSSGENIANAVYQCVEQWNLTDRVKFVSYDTTAANSGVKSGAATLLEKKISRKLTHLPCRHHIFEIILRAVFETKLYPTSAPEVPIFERFANAWNDLDRESFRSGIEDETVCSKISQAERSDILEFCNNQLKKVHSRKDYEELLQLAIIFLGGGTFKFKIPGPTSHARWMAKALYRFKIFLFRDQFPVTKRDIDGFRDICIFLIKLYIKVWFGSTNAIASPLQDLNFVKSAIQYSETDADLSKVVLKKMTNHLWYLDGGTVTLAFFDTKVPFEEKRKMVERLKSVEPVVKLSNGRHYSNLLDFEDVNLSDFVSEKTKQLFEHLGLFSNFLELDPSTWETAFDFEEGWSFFRNLSVVNDTAERAIKFVQDYNRVLTTDEEEHRMILQLVESYKNKYSSYKKSVLLQ